MSTVRIPSTPNRTPSLEEKIRFRAYELFLNRGAQHGRDLDDWLQAEAELLRSKLGPTPVPTPIRPAPAKRSRAKKNGN